MEEVKTITISCQGAVNLSLDELTELQGNLKDLIEENYIKIRNSIIEYGFSFPIFFWQDTNGTKYIIDAHQRKRTLTKMREEGFTIPPLPAVEIFAKDKIEAKKKLLLLNSRYGKITREGYDEFIDDPDSQIIESDMTDLLEIPEIEIYADAESQEPTKTNSDDTGGDPTKTREITCPACAHKFTLFDSNKE